MCLSPVRSRGHERLQLAAEDEGRHRVDQVHLEHLRRRHLGQGQPPGVARAQVDLLQVDVERALGEQVHAAGGVVVGVGDLRQRGRGEQADPRSAAVPDVEAGGVGGIAVRELRRPREHGHAGLVRAQQRLQLRRQVGMGAGLEVEQVRIEGRRPAHRLAGVVDQDVEAAEAPFEVPREDLDRRRVAQVEPVDLEAVLPLREVALARVALGGVVGKARGGDHLAAGAQDLERGLEADLHPRARDHRHAAVQRGGLEALVVVEGRAVRAQRVVEEMKPGEVRLADVAALGLAERRAVRLRAFPRRRGDPRRGGRHEDGGLARRADPGRRARLAIVVLHLLLLAPAELLHQPGGLVPRRTRGPSRGEDQGLPLGRRNVGQESAVRDDRFQQGDAEPHLVERERRCFRQQRLQRPFRHDPPVPRTTLMMVRC